MTLTLIDQDTKQRIGQLNYNHIPRKDEFLKFQSNIYCVSAVLYDAELIELRVFKTKLD